MCPTTVMPLHVATAKGSWRLRLSQCSHGDKPAFRLLHLTTPPRKSNIKPIQL